VDNIAGKGGAGALMTFGTYIRMFTNRVQGRVKVVDAGYRLAPVTLAAGKVCADGVDVFSFLHVTINTVQVLIKLDRAMGISEPGADTYLRCGRTVGKGSHFDSRNTHQRTEMKGPSLVFLIIARTELALFIASD
jgi:hypothetical protein